MLEARHPQESISCLSCYCILQGRPVSDHSERDGAMQRRHSKLLRLDGKIKLSILLADLKGSSKSCQAVSNQASKAQTRAEFSPAWLLGTSCSSRASCAVYYKSIQALVNSSCPPSHFPPTSMRTKSRKMCSPLPSASMLLLMFVTCIPVSTYSLRSPAPGQRPKGRQAPIGWLVHVVLLSSCIISGFM